jgi:hypothetical protein
MTRPIGYPCGIRIRHTPAEGKLNPEHCQMVFVFLNGWEVSAVYGAAVYSHKQDGQRFNTHINQTDYASTVEVAIFNSRKDMVPFKDGDTVKGFATVAELTQILEWVSTQA